MSSDIDRIMIRNQLQVLKGQAVLVLEETVKYLQSGGDVSDTLLRVSRIFQSVSEDLEAKAKWETVLQEQGGLAQLEATINNAFDGLLQLRTVMQGPSSESIESREELLNARLEDQTNMAELEAVIAQTPQSSGSLATRAQQSIDRNLKIIGDPTVAQPHQDAKRALTIVARLTGQTLPPETLLGKDFVAVGQHAIYQGSSYDVFLGEYFTGEKIAIKKLRHRVDEATAKKTHERFARQALNWSSLQHDAMLRFYGMGVEPSPAAPGEFQMRVLDVARGLKYLHEADDLPQGGRGIVHSALNISNVLIKDSGRAVISGFGHAKVLKDSHESFTGDNTEYRYMGPELMQDDAHLSHGTDVYSWGMTSLEILTDVPPFGAKTKGPKIIQLVALGKTPKREDHPKLEEYSGKDALWSLFEESWNPTPEARPSANHLVKTLKPLLQELGKKDEKAVEKPVNPPYAPGKGPAPTEYGKTDPRIIQTSPPKGDN
ncbi:hypothetical protein FRC07_001107 [Ceratobasidium sp. 392]|nr:hypothetical protein FRC07_001107 [Ceratobasidium sp. 392]